jgi:hypothetical protein
MRPARRTRNGPERKRLRMRFTGAKHTKSGAAKRRIDTEDDFMFPDLIQQGRLENRLGRAGAPGHAVFHLLVLLRADTHRPAIVPQDRRLQRTKRNRSRLRLRGIATDELVEITQFPILSLLLVNEGELGLVEFLEKFFPGNFVQTAFATVARKIDPNDSGIVLAAAGFFDPGRRPAARFGPFTCRRGSQG